MLRGMMSGLAAVMLIAAVPAFAADSSSSTVETSTSTSHHSTHIDAGADIDAGLDDSEE
jgi:hypothetical protein